MAVLGSLGEWLSMAVYGNDGPWRSRGMAVLGDLAEWQSKAV